MNEEQETIPLDTIPTEHDEIISVLDITEQLEIVNETLEKMQYIQPLNEMLLNRIEILIILQIVMIGLIMYALFRRSHHA